MKYLTLTLMLFAAPAWAVSCKEWKGEAFWKNASSTIVKQCFRGDSVHDRNQEGRTPLHMAAAHGTAKAVNELIFTHRADIQARSRNGEVPLHVVGSAENVRALVKAGASTEERNQYGHTPLHRAGTAEVANALIAAGADINAKDNGGYTPLHMALTAGTVNVLVTAGGNTEARSASGETPLHWAAAHRSPETIRALIRHGADMRAQTKDGRFPFNMAQRNERLHDDPVYWELNEGRF